MGNIELQRTQKEIALLLLMLWILTEGGAADGR